uniref:Uncharacterized protein LOC111121223 n=1 Tax=Crassostrea virginica TaxID=6565 RepID=A0A8B8CQQ5_CRAVI|nr:uncharacterized protein LOC111121223 [Crassostrea virginica]XP_022318100.1 uncharacterized protein LOC111121223 [Crassostrea virginica]XP_022318101.1 uncharacterized protein LOC111121223 [Crassostrea virginica]
MAGTIPSTSGPYVLSSPTDQLRIGIPKPPPRNRYITVAKTHVPLFCYSEKHKRILSRLPMDKDPDDFPPLPHRMSTIPEVKKSQFKSVIRKPGVLRMHTFSEFSARGEQPDFSGLQINKPSEVNESSDGNTPKRSGNGSRKQEYYVSKIQIQERETTMLSLDGMSTSLTHRSRDVSNVETAVRYAIKKYMSTIERQPKIQYRHNQSETVVINHCKKESVPQNEDEDPNPNSHKNGSKHSSKKDTSKNNNQYVKLVKPILSKIITGTPACMFKLFGPILLSAPHGIKLWRGGTEGRRRRIHYREIHVTEILLKVANEINRIAGIPPSFIIWDRRVAMPADFKNLDPNYLTEKQFPQSPFHEALEYFKHFGRENKLPLLHIDMHGKKNRKTNMDLDVGFKAMETHWKDQSFVKWLKNETECVFTNMFSDPKYIYEKNNMRFTVNVNPSLCGDWGGDLYTMTCQSVVMGTPAFQLEIPRAIRNQLIVDDELVTKLAQSIVDIYSICLNHNKPLHMKIPKREQASYTEFIDKTIADHLKIEKTVQEKQI